MTKKTLKEYCNEIDIWDGWLNNYKKYVPNFIEEAKTKVSWQDWDKGVFSEFITTSLFYERRTGQNKIELE